MTGGTGQDAPAQQVSTSMVLDDSDYAIPDEWGLKEAYNDSQSVVHHGDTLYIAGTHSLRDVLDDALIPLHLVRNSQRYQQAYAALQRPTAESSICRVIRWAAQSRLCCKKTQ